MYFFVYIYSDKKKKEKEEEPKNHHISQPKPLASTSPPLPLARIAWGWFLLGPEELYKISKKVAFGKDFDHWEAQEVTFSKRVRFIYPQKLRT